MKIEIPKSIPAEVARWEIMIKRADKQKLRQPLNKRMTAEAYAAWISRQKAD